MLFAARCNSRFQRRRVWHLSRFGLSSCAQRALLRLARQHPLDADSLVAAGTGVPDAAGFSVCRAARRFRAARTRRTAVPPAACFSGELRCGCLLPLAYTGPTWTVYLLLFGLVAAIRIAIASRPLGLAAIAGLAAGSQLAIWLALAQFPWKSRLAAIRANARPHTRRPFAAPPSRRRSAVHKSVEIVQLWPFRQLYVDSRTALLDRTDFGLTGPLGRAVRLYEFLARAGDKGRRGLRAVSLPRSCLRGCRRAACQLLQIPPSSDQSSRANQDPAVAHPRIRHRFCCSTPGPVLRICPAMAAAVARSNA